MQRQSARAGGRIAPASSPRTGRRWRPEHTYVCACAFMHAANVGQRGQDGEHEVQDASARAPGAKGVIAEKKTHGWRRHFHIL